MNSPRRIGILGGMFDPIHCGHLDVGAAAERALALSRLLVLPSNIPPHRAQPVASSHHRFAMAAMAVAGRVGWEALDLELRDAAFSYTSDTLQRLHGKGFSASELFFITGADAFLEIATWKNYPALFDLAHFVVVSRTGATAQSLRARLPDLAARMREAGVATDGQTFIFLIDAPTADVSSTAIRQARHDGQSIAGLVPPAVQQHIEQHHLYTAPSDTALRHSDADALSVPSKAGRLHGQD